MNDYIGKPVKVLELFTTMARWITPARPAFIAQSGFTDPPGADNGQAADIAIATGAGQPEALPALLGSGTAADAASAGKTDLIPALPGIDTAAGLAITQHNQRLYRRLLRRFADTQSQFASHFAAALAAKAKDPDAPTRCAHSLKGVAANIGAEGVREAAAALEHACKQDQDAALLQALLERTLRALATVIDGLRALGDSDQIGAAAGATLAAPAENHSGRAVVDQAAIDAELKALRTLVENDDTDAIQALTTLAEHLSATAAAMRIEPIAKALEAFDFEAALEALAELEGTLEASHAQD